MLGGVPYGTSRVAHRAQVPRGVHPGRLIDKEDGMPGLWKKGRGKLGPLAPIQGEWVAEADSPRGRIRCHRQLVPVLGGKYLQLDVRWEFGLAGATTAYEEHALIGVRSDDAVGFWSF